MNFPDLSLMEPLSEILEISVSELLGLENESADQVIKDITAISEEEKKASNRRYWKGFCAAAVILLSKRRIEKYETKDNYAHTN